MKKRLLSVLPPFLLFLAAFALFAPSIRYAFVNLDDPIFIINNPIVFNGFSRHAVVQTFTGLHGDQTMYTPFLWLSYLLDSLLFGATPLNPWGYHFGNVLLHAANAVLLFFILREGARHPWAAFAAALLWAVHPLRVESVAWITERKDTLSTFFAFASILAYLRARRADAASPRLSFSLSFAFFVCGLLAKPMLVTLPFLFLLFDFWPLRRIPLRTAHLVLPRLALEKWPFFLLIPAVSVLTYRLQTGAIVHIPLVFRLLRLPSNYFFYFSRTVWPAGLCPLAPGLPATLPWIVASVAFFAILGTVALLLFRRIPGLAFGLLAFAGLLFPVSGVVFIGTVPVADRYSYLPSLGLAFSLAALADAFWPRRVLPRFAAAAVFAAALLALSAVSLHILPAWQNPGAFARRAEKIVPGHSLFLMDRFSEAFYTQGDVQASNDAADAIWEQKPFAPFSVLVKVLALGQISTADAIAFYESHPPQGLDPETGDSLDLAMTVLYADANDFDKAAPHLEKILAKRARHPKYAEVVSSIAFWVFAAQRLDDRAAAIARSHPGMDGDRPLARENFLVSATSMWNIGFHRQALPRFLRLTRECPNNPSLLNNVAWLLATPLNSPADPDEVLAIARRALDLSPGNPVLLDTYAVCLAFGGRFEEALQIETGLAESLPSSTAGDAAALLAQVEKHIRLFRQNLPYTENSAAILLYAR